MTASRMNRTPRSERRVLSTLLSDGGKAAAGPMPGFADKVRFLKRPASYAEKTRRVEAIETHMSWVFLTERQVYKLKKPVRYDFLDFTTLEARRRDCLAEVRLNRRLAPDIYLGVAPLSLDPEGGLRLGPGPCVVEWLVHMRRLPAARMLDRAISEGTAQADDVRAIADLLAGFYRHLRPARMSPVTYRRRLAREVKANKLELCKPRYGMPCDRVTALADAQSAFLRRRADLFDERVRAGRIIEGHGDLRAEHVCLTSSPVVIDCLEFKRAFRIVDPADELAFLALDCERLGARWVRPLLFETYRRRTKDAVPEPLVGFYGSCRALLRAKIALWHLNEPEVPTPARWRKLALHYLRLGETWGADLVS